MTLQNNFNRNETIFVKACAHVYMSIRKVRFEILKLLSPCILDQYVVGSCFATVRFMMIHFYNLYRVGPCIPNATSLSQLKRPFPTYCTSSSFPVCMCFFFFYFSAVPLSWLWFLPHMTYIKKTEKKKISRQLTLHSFLMSSEPQPGPPSTKWKVV